MQQEKIFSCPQKATDLKDKRAMHIVHTGQLFSVECNRTQCIQSVKLQLYMVLMQQFLTDGKARIKFAVLSGQLGCRILIHPHMRSSIQLF